MGVALLEIPIVLIVSFIAWRVSTVERRLNLVEKYLNAVNTFVLQNTLAKAESIEPNERV